MQDNEQIRGLLKKDNEHIRGVIFSMKTKNNLGIIVIARMLEIQRDRILFYIFGGLM